MIRRKDEINVSIEKKFNGEGELYSRKIAQSESELNNKGKMFVYSTLQPGCSVGYHVHRGTSEIYYFLSGSGEYNDNGFVTTIGEGDTTITQSGEGHSIKNTGEEPLNFIALILNE